MEKNLRSLIHENIPFDLRVELDLLSRKRGMINEEKQEEIINLLRKYDVDNVTNLAPGTNRYAFKLNGFVIKVATDHDGKIDNLKEFKMSKRLYPKMSKTYEVSQNGLLVVAEYIPPFESYSEMLQYAAKIKKILSELSSVYLIGDVGISSKNFSNWGIRPGTDDPTCFDYAYVYDVTSDLFVCRECGSMLVPNEDFVALHCSNKLCGKIVEFETLRGRIGDDIHRHQIGDLSEEGYLMNRSNVITQLTEERSNYLIKSHQQSKKEENKKEKTEGVENLIDTSFVMEKPKGGKEMAMITNNQNGNNLVFDAKSITIVKKSPKKSIDDKKEKTEDEKAVVVEVSETTIVENQQEEEKETSVVFSATVDPDLNFAPKEVKPKEPEDDNLVDDNLLNFIQDHSMKAISKLSNRIAISMKYFNLYDNCKNFLHDKKMTNTVFYKTIQNAIFRSLVKLCEFTEMDVPNGSNNGTRKIFIPPTDVKVDKRFVETLIFIERLWNNSIFIPEDLNPLYIMDIYNEQYDDYKGIQTIWIPLLKSRISEKLAIDSQGIDYIAEIIKRQWCVPEDEYEDDDDEISSIEKAAINAIQEEETKTEPVVESETTIVEDEGIFISQDSEEMEEVDTFDNNKECITVDIYPDHGYDIIRISGFDDYGKIILPMYIPDGVDGFDISSKTPELIDKRNGHWNWLSLFCPTIVFETERADYYLQVNEKIEEEEDQCHFIVLGKHDEKYTIGIYFVTGVFIVDQDGNPTSCFDDELLNRLNILITENIQASKISHFERSSKIDEIRCTEDYIQGLIDSYEDNNDEDEDEYEDDDDEISSIEKAAINAIQEEETKTEPVVEDPKTEEEPSKRKGVIRVRN